MNNDTDFKIDLILEDILSQPYTLMLMNDSLNSFEWVITCLMNIFNYDIYRSETIANIAHFNGECDIKRGPKDIIEAYATILKELNLLVRIEKCD